MIRIMCIDFLIINVPASIQIEVSKELWWLWIELKIQTCNPI